MSGRTSSERVVGIESDYPDKGKAINAALLYKTKKYSNSQIREMVGFKSNSTLYRYLRYEGTYK